MSRIGKNPITIPNGVTVNVEKGGRFGHLQITVTGPKGTLQESLRAPVVVAVEDNQVVVTRPNDLKQNRSYHGLYRALIANMVEGVTNGYSKDLEIVGIGYRAEQKGESIVLSLGYSHKIEYNPPAGITAQATDQTQIKISGIDKTLVGQEAAKIRAFRKPEPYKGKGVRYKGEQVARKSVKQSK
jgi:large subunit ribosomal protein L6